MKWLVIGLIMLVLIGCATIHEVAHVKIVTVSLNTENKYTEVVYANNASDGVRRADTLLYYASDELLAEFKENIGAVYEITVEGRTITHATLLEKGH